MQTVFKTIDGQEFPTEELAGAHEEKVLNKVKAFYVTKRNFSMNEPGGFTFKHGIILVHADQNPEVYAELWCQQTYGPRIALAYQGHNPFVQWELRPYDNGIREALKLTVLAKVEASYMAHRRLWDDSTILG